MDSNEEEFTKILDNIFSEIYKKAGVSEDFQSDFEFWVVENSFVSEPFIGGLQLGQLPEFEIKGANILHISQVDFDKLMTAYHDYYGYWHDT